jgi:hypothetical protein
MRGVSDTDAQDMAQRHRILEVSDGALRGLKPHVPLACAERQSWPCTTDRPLGALSRLLVPRAIRRDEHDLHAGRYLCHLTSRQARHLTFRSHQSQSLVDLDICLAANDPTGQWMGVSSPAV